MVPLGLAFGGLVAYMAALGVVYFTVMSLRERRSRLGMRRAPLTAYWPELAGILLAVLLGVAGIAAGASLAVAGL